VSIRKVRFTSFYRIAVSEYIRQTVRATSRDEKTQALEHSTIRQISQRVDSNLRACRATSTHSYIRWPTIHGGSCKSDDASPASSRSSRTCYHQQAACVSASARGALITASLCHRGRKSLARVEGLLLEDVESIRRITQTA